MEKNKETNNEDKVIKVIYKYWRYHCEHEDEEESLHEAMISATLDEEYGEAYAEEIVVYKADMAGNTYTEVYDREGMDRYRHQHYKEHYLWEEWFKDWEEPEVVRKRQEEKQKKYEEYLNRKLTHAEILEVLKKISRLGVDIFAYGRVEDNDCGVYIECLPYVHDPVYSMFELMIDQGLELNYKLHQKSYDEIQHIFKSLSTGDEEQMWRDLFNLLKEAGLYREKYEPGSLPKSKRDRFYFVNKVDFSG